MLRRRKVTVLDLACRTLPLRRDKRFEPLPSCWH
jgi:hypothetical protein